MALEPWEEAWHTGRAAWAALDVPAPAFARHFSTVALEASGGAFHAGDLYLACAAAEGVPAAIRELDRLVAPMVARASRRLHLAIGEDDACQLVRERLLLPDLAAGRPPRIATYSGRGRLDQWLRVVVVRTLLNRAVSDRNRERSFEDGLLERLLGTGGDVELAYMKRLYRDEFRAAFTDALTSLDAREKNVLRLAFLESVTIDALGAIYGVHRATAARWIARAEHALFERVRIRFRERLGVDADEAASILRLVMSRLDITFETYLREATT
jgi:RNA polymerase sigma-70 factor (ECF subfamily)